MSIIPSFISLKQNGQLYQLMLEDNLNSYHFNVSGSMSSSFVFWLEDSSFTVVNNPEVTESYYIRVYNRKLSTGEAGEYYLFYLGMHDGLHRFVTRHKSSIQKNKLFTTFSIRSFVSSNTVTATFETFDYVGWFKRFNFKIPSFTGTFVFSTPSNNQSNWINYNSYPRLPSLPERSVSISSFSKLFSYPLEHVNCSNATNLSLSYTSINWLPNNYQNNNQNNYQNNNQNVNTTDTCGPNVNQTCSTGYACVYNQNTYQCEKIPCTCDSGEICVTKGNDYQCINAENFIIDNLDVCSDCTINDICILNSDFKSTKKYNCIPKNFCQQCANGQKCIITNGVPTCTDIFPCEGGCGNKQQCVTSNTGQSKCVSVNYLPVWARWLIGILGFLFLLMFILYFTVPWITDKNYNKHCKPKKQKGEIEMKQFGQNEDIKFVFD